MLNLFFSFNVIKVYIYGFYISAIAMLLITLYGAYFGTMEYLQTGKVIIGEILVKTHFPTSGSFNLVTYLMIFSVIAWYAITKIFENKTSQISKTIKSVGLIIILIFWAVSLYELVYNIFLLNSLMTKSAITNNLDFETLNIPYPTKETPWNLIFATKMFLAGTLITSHAFFVISSSIKKTSKNVNVVE